MSLLPLQQMVAKETGVDARGSHRLLHNILCEHVRCHMMQEDTQVDGYMDHSLNCEGVWPQRAQQVGACGHMAHHVVPLVAALFRDTRAPEVAPMS